MVIGLSFSINDYLFGDVLAVYFKASPSLASMLLWDLAYWPTWAALAPLIYGIARRFPLARDIWHPNLLVNVLLRQVQVVVSASRKDGKLRLQIEGQRRGCAGRG